MIGKTVELAGLHRDGRELPIELSLATWSVGDQRFFSGIIRDITERKRTEHALQLANKSLNEENDQLEALSVKLAKYLSRQVYSSIFEGRTDVPVKSYRKELTVFFSDIAPTGWKPRCSAMAMAMAMRERFVELREAWMSHLGPSPMHIRIGINTG